MTQVSADLGCDVTHGSAATVPSRLTADGIGNGRAVLDRYRLHAQCVKLSIKRHKIVDDLSMRVQPGSLTAVIGPSGAGKS